jgi:hypothetical protein
MKVHSIRKEQLDLWIGRKKWVLYTSGWRCRNNWICEYKVLSQACNDGHGKLRKCEKNWSSEMPERNVLWKVETCIAHYLVGNKIPWCPQTYPLQCRNTDASHHAPCKTNTKNLVLVFIMLYKIKTFYNYWLPSAICRRFSFPCHALIFPCRWLKETNICDRVNPYYCEPWV